MLANKIKGQIKAVELINIRVARGGCFVARYFLGTRKIKGFESDMMCEIKIYDNMPYLKPGQIAKGIALK
jgi:hypothetical protein